MGGIYRSINNGESWTKLKKGLDTLNSNYFDLRIDPKDANIIYVAQFTNEFGKKGKDKKSQGTLYRSENRGMSWESIDPKNLNKGGDPWKPGPDFVQVQNIRQGLVECGRRKTYGR